MKSNKKFFPRLTININQIKENIPKTERKLSVPNLNNNFHSFNQKNKEKNSQIKLNLNNIKVKRKNTSQNISKNNLHFSNKKVLNPKYIKLIDNKNFIESYNSKNGRNIPKNNDIMIRYSVNLNKNFIKNKLNSVNSKDIHKERSSKLLINKVLLKSKRYSTITKASRNEKRNNHFEYEKEDKLFKKLLNKKKKKKQKKIILPRSYNNSLLKVYKKIPYILTELDEVKKLKNDMSLLNYQKSLLDVGGKVLNRELNSKLSQKFFEIRKSTEIKIEYFENIIDSIENKEKKIIRKINKQQNFFKKIMVNNNKANLVYGINRKIDLFPQIKFYPTPKYLLSNYNKML